MPSGAPGNARDRRWRPLQAAVPTYSGWNTPPAPVHPLRPPARPCPKDRWSAAPAPHARRCFALPSHNPGPDRARCSPARKTWTPHARQWPATFGSPAPMPDPACMTADSCGCSARPPSTPRPQTPLRRRPPGWPQRCARGSVKKRRKIETGPGGTTACAPRNEQTIQPASTTTSLACRRRKPRRSPAEFLSLSHRTIVLVLS